MLYVIYPEIPNQKCINFSHKTLANLQQAERH